MKQVCDELKSERRSPSDRRFETRTRVWAASLEGSLDSLRLRGRFADSHLPPVEDDQGMQQVASLLAHSEVHRSLCKPEMVNLILQPRITKAHEKPAT